MKVFTKYNIFSDFVSQRNKALRAISNTKICRELTPWDRVGSESDMKHNEEVKKWLDDTLGEYTIINPTRQFNSCMKNPYNFAHVHYDDFDYIVLIYLNLPNQYDSNIDGTILCSHKETGNDIMNDQVCKDINDNYDGFMYQNTFEEVLFQEEVIYTSDYMNPDKWNTDIFIPMKANKAIMFECRQLHRESRNFGDGLVSSRLVEVLYIKEGK